MSGQDSPGVYIEEAAGPHVIDGVEMATAGFVGACERGPFDAQLVTSFVAFARDFGSMSESFLPAAVRGFFENGGRRCYIARVAGPGGDAPTADDFIGATGERSRGLAALREVNDIALLGVPDEVNGLYLPDATDRARVRAAMVSQCEEMGDRFAVLQVNGTETDVSVIELPLASSFAAMYYPWLEVIDPTTGTRHLVPPGGHVIGAIAGSTIERGVQNAPANIEVRGVVGLGLPGVIPPSGLVPGDRASEILRLKGINVIRDFRSAHQGIRIWGARTLAVDTEFKYVSVRRLFLYVEHSITRGIHWVVFEPNTSETWAKVQQCIAEFLTTVWRDGALAGSTPDKAFFVKCDRTTMSQADIDAGRLVCEIGLAPTRPAEFVIVRIGQWTADAGDNP